MLPVAVAWGETRGRMGCRLKYEREERPLTKPYRVPLTCTACERGDSQTIACDAA